MNRTNLDSYCGIYCGACPDDDKECLGCKSENTREPECEFRVCNIQKGLNNCSECSRFPCGKVIEMSKSEWPHHKTALPNLERIKEVGIELWLKEQDSENRCASCGQRIFWYRKCCSVK